MCFVSVLQLVVFVVVFVAVVGDDGDGVLSLSVIFKDSRSVVDRLL